MPRLLGDTLFKSRRRALSLLASGSAAFTLTQASLALATDDKSVIIQPDIRTDKSFIKRAFDMRQLATKYGDQAYGAVVVRGLRIIGQSWSRVVIDEDPTGHAEMAAIRDAARRERNRDLSGATLYSSSRPCPMCEAAAHWAGISALVYSASAMRVVPPQLCASNHTPVALVTPERFLTAAATNNTDILSRGLLQGSSVDTRDHRDRTALLIATYNDATDAARLLIEQGADVNAMDNQHDSPYLYAGAEGKLEILKLTVAANADLSSVNRYGGTALIPAAHHGHVDVVKYLLTTETDINHVNFLGWTALLEAVILGDGGPTHQAIVKLLVNADADRSIGDDDGLTALEHAKESGYTEMVDLLSWLGPRI